MGISKVHARTIYDSRGNPTVEGINTLEYHHRLKRPVEVTTETGVVRAVVPSGMWKADRTISAELNGVRSVNRCARSA